jgi:hypothetical protein
VGEARRRQHAIATGAPSPYVNPRTGEVDIGRRAPSIRALYEMTRQLRSADNRGERVAARVPCNGCTACCHASKVDFDPALERPEDLRHLDFVSANEITPGWARLRKRDDGACVHLGPQGCMVYEHRPRVCRLYDCRFLAVAGVIEPYEGGHQAPVWIPEGHTLRDRQMAGALLFAMTEMLEKHPDWTSDQIALAAWQRMPEILPVIRALTEQLQQQFSPAAIAAWVEKSRPKTGAELNRIIGGWESCRGRPD